MIPVFHQRKRQRDKAGKNPDHEATLGSYALLNLFFGVRFFLSYRRRLERATDRAVRSFRQGMIEVWTGELDAVVEEPARLRNEAQARGKELSGLAGHSSPKP